MYIADMLWYVRNTRLCCFKISYISEKKTCGRNKLLASLCTYEYICCKGRYHGFSFCILCYLCITIYVLFIFYVTLPPGIGPIAVDNKYNNNNNNNIC
jgi:hypothetical protein